MVITNYRKAWIDYVKHGGYKYASDTLKKAGIKQPYRDNILMNAFEAAWLASGKKIKQIELK